MDLIQLNNSSILSYIIILKRLTYIRFINKKQTKITRFLEKISRNTCGILKTVLKTKPKEEYYQVPYFYEAGGRDQSESKTPFNLLDPVYSWFWHCESRLLELASLFSMTKKNPQETVWGTCGKKALFLKCLFQTVFIIYIIAYDF